MATEIASAYVTLIPSLKGAKSSIESQFSGMDFSGAGKAMGKSLFGALDADFGSLGKKMSSFGGKASAAFSAFAKPAVGALTAIGTAIGGLAVSGGITRALKLESAEHMFKGMHMSAEEIESAMKSANDAVLGTAFGLDSAAVATAMLKASGVELGESMDKSLKAIAGTASMAGTSMEDITDIFQSVAANGKLSGEELARLADRGVAARQILAQQLGISGDELSEMVKKGEIDFDTFSNAMFEAFGDAAYGANETFQGAMANVQAALSRVGVLFADPALDGLRQVFVASIDAVNTMKAALQPLADRFSSFVDGTVPKLVAGIKAFGNSLKAATDEYDEFGNKLSEKETASFTDWMEAFAVGIDTAFGEGTADKIAQVTTALGMLAALGSSLKLMGAGMTAIQPLANAFDSIVSSIPSSLGRIGNTVSTAFGTIKTGATAVKNAMSALGGSFKTFAASMALGLNPQRASAAFSAFADIANAFKTGWSGAMNEISLSFGKVGSIVSRGISALGANINEGFGGIPGKVVKHLGNFNSVVGESLKNASATFAKKMNFNVLSSKFGALGIVAKGVASTIGKGMSSAGKAVMSATATMGKGVISAAGALGGLSVGLLGLGAAAALGKVDLQQMAVSVLSNMNQLTTNIGPMADQLASMLPEFLNNVSEALPLLIEAFSTAFQTIADALPTILPALIESITTLVTQLVPLLISMAPVLLSAGMQLFTGLIQALAQTAPALIAQLPSMISMFLNVLLANMPALISASIQLFMGIAIGLIQALPQIVSILIAAIPMFVQAVASCAPMMLEGGKQLFNSIGRALGEVGPKIIDALINLITHLPEIIASAVGSMLEAGSKLFESFMLGLMGAQPEAEAAAANTAEAASDAAANAIDGSEAAKNFSESFANEYDFSANEDLMKMDMEQFSENAAATIDASPVGMKFSESAASSIDPTAFSESAKAMVDSAVEAASSVDSSIIGKLFSDSAASGIDDSTMISSAQGMVYHLASDLDVSPIKEAFSDLAGWASTVGEGLSASLTNGISGAHDVFIAAKDSMIASLEALAATAEYVGTVVRNRLDIPDKTIQVNVEQGHVVLPHFSMSGNFDPKTGSVPEVSVSWWKKGGVFTQPAIIGVGEGREPEGVFPLSKLEKMMQAGTVNNYSINGMDYLPGSAVANIVDSLFLQVASEMRMG